jgi:SSS family solute:Na+ symporter
MKYISGQLYVYLQSVQAYISPPIAAVFLLGVFWKRVNAKGAITSLLTGLVLGMGRLVLELTKGSQSGFLFWYADINFLHFAILLFAVCTAVLVVVSLATPPESDDKLAGLTFATAAAPAAGDGAAAARRASNRAWRRWDLWLSVLLAACVGLVWLFFRG